MTERPGQAPPAQREAGAPSEEPPAAPFGRRELAAMVVRTLVCFALVLAILLLWRGSTLFLYEGF